MSDEDKELELLKAKRLAEMQKNLSIQDQSSENKTEERVSVAFNTQSILQMQRMRDTIDTRMGILK